MSEREQMVSDLLKTSRHNATEIMSVFRECCKNAGDEATFFTFLSKAWLPDAAETYGEEMGAELLGAITLGYECGSMLSRGVD